MSFCTRQFITRATTHSTNTFAPEEHCLAALVIVPEAPRIAQAPSVPIQHLRNITMPVCQQSKSRCERASLSINHAAMTAACTHTQREREREREEQKKRSLCVHTSSVQTRAQTTSKHNLQTPRNPHARTMCSNGMSRSSRGFSRRIVVVTAAAYQPLEKRPLICQHVAKRPQPGERMGGAEQRQ